MNSDIRFYVNNSGHEVTRDFHPAVMFYGQLCGPVISGEFAGSQMIRVTECPEWAPFQYGNDLVGRLIPTALVTHGFDFPKRDITTGLFRKFLVYAGFVLPAECEDRVQLIASSELYADALEHAYAHARYANEKRLYSIVDRDKADVICQASFYPEDPAKSWSWGAAA